MTVVQLICDAPSCDHTEPVEGLFESDIGKPCPKCGADLLTREDYEAGKRYEALIKLMGQAGLLADEPGPGVMSLSVNPHAGAVNLRVGEPGK